MKIIVYVLLLSALTALNACRTREQSGDTANYIIQGDTIIIPGNSNLTSKLKTAVVQSEPYRLQMLTAGTVKAIPTQYAEIAPPFSGRVIKSYIRLGMKVTPETPLFEISSPDFMTAQKIFFQEKSQMQLAEKTLKRQQDLIANGVGTQKDLEESQTAFEVEKKEYENAVIGIKIFRADPDHLALGQPMVIRSPIAGEVLDNKIIVGKFINDNAASIAIVAELSKVWVAGQVKEKDIRFIHALDECDISIAALPEKKIKGKVYHVNEIVDEDTRSVQVLVECDNRDHTLKPGMYVTVSFVNAPGQAILIPAKAVLQMNDASFVFIEAETGKYIKRKVATGGSQGDRVVIKSGLDAGDKIVSAGGLLFTGCKMTGPLKKYQ